MSVQFIIDSTKMGKTGRSGIAEGLAFLIIYKQVAATQL
jgi:hypothetical protein